jgi:hypothetical protein
MLVLDAKSDLSGCQTPVECLGHDLAPLMCVEGRYYQVSVTPGGDRLSVTPSATPVGYVDNGRGGFAMLRVFGDRGVITAVPDKLGKIALPPGRWRLAAYALGENRSNSLTSHESPDYPHSPTSHISQLRRGDFVYARGTADCPPIEVRDDQTTIVPFGPPYRPVVTPSALTNGIVRFALSYRGRAGEVPNHLMLGDALARRPTVTILDKNGVVVGGGRFEYG